MIEIWPEMKARHAKERVDNVRKMATTGDTQAVAAKKAKMSPQCLGKYATDNGIRWGKPDKTGPECRHPHCSTVLHRANKSGMCRDHAHSEYCQCVACRNRQSAEQHRRQATAFDKSNSFRAGLIPGGEV